ncbi:hypothetical protein [Xanthomonas phage vB_XooS_NR08]|nr:hypothetical protein [Xanthomonas phage vB_XooS_NR08]
MADCAINKIDSNITGLAYAEEECLKQLPTTPVWYGLEPNSYSDFGGELSTVARAPIDPSRQNKKGTITDLDASGGFNSDFTKSNLTRLLQGFFFADARELASTAPINGAAVAISGVAASTKTYTVASGGAAFAANMLVNATGFANAANNGLKTVASSTATTVVVNETLIDEAAPPAGVKLEVVGRQLAAADANIAVTSGVASLVVTAGDFTTMPELFPGRWVFIGGDAASNRFANNVGYARIKSVSAKALVFDDTTFAAATETGTGKSIRLFVGVVIKNEKNPALIKRRSYNIERQLGQGLNGVQAEYLEGAVANEFTLNIPQADKLNADLTFIACDNTHRSGDVGDEIKTGTRIAAPGEDAYNTSSDIYRIKMNVLDPASSNPAALFGYVSEANVSINNNVSPNKAVGILGAFDTTAGNFEVGGSITAYFTTVAAVKAVRANADVGLSVISAAKNAGFIFDIPLLGLGGGRLNVEKDAPITVPLEPAGAENPNGYTMLYEVFSYLPTVAMPD